MKYWDGATGASGPGRPSVAPGVSDVLPAQLEAVISEVRRLEETATKNEEELTVIMEDRQPPPTGGIRGELDQLKHRLGTEIRNNYYQTKVQVQIKSLLIHRFGLRLTL